MPRQDYSVIIPHSYKPRPSTEEISTADILADFFQADVKFIKRSTGKTPDFLINGAYWELKSPVGNGKHNIQHKLQDAATQSCNVILDGRKSKFHPTKLKNEVQHQFEIIKQIKRLVFINKSGKVVELFRKK